MFSFYATARRPRMRQVLKKHRVRSLSVSGAVVLPLQLISAVRCASSVDGLIQMIGHCTTKKSACRVVK